MEAVAGRMSTSEVLAGIGVLLDRAESDRSGLEAGARLECARLARSLAGRIGALADLLLAEADRSGASMGSAGTPISSWLAVDQRLSKREVAGALHRATELAAHPVVGEAATTGAIGAGQARAITRVLDGLAPQLDAGQQQRAERLMVGLASSLDADQLARAAGRVLREVAPEGAEGLVEAGLQREAEQAVRDRSLRFWREGGSMRFDGSLPQVEAEGWLSVLDGYTEARRRTAVEERDPLAVTATPEQRRADALIAMIGAHRSDPAAGGGQARVVVMLDFAGLCRDAAGAGLIGDGQPLSAGELRRLCCDAAVLPVVLGGPSEVLDVGRECRLVTPAIRAALLVRDRGCAFPGCQARPAQCEAHHIVPWWAGGETALPNLVLLCHHHHGLLEPARHGLRDQWEVRIALDGAPEFLPPARTDPQRRPIRHTRVLARTA